MKDEWYLSSTPTMLFTLPENIRISVNVKQIEQLSLTD